MHTQWATAGDNGMNGKDRDNTPRTEGPEQTQPHGGRIKQLTLRLPEEYHRKLKILAACSGKSMTEILVTCIDERLQTCLQRELDNVK
jgi:hypothetical protein